MMPELNSMKTFLCMVFLIVITSCDAEKSKRIRYIAKREVATKCKRGTCVLQQGHVENVKSTINKIKDEAYDGNHPYLNKSYNELNRHKKWKVSQSEGDVRGLSEEETKAVFLYTMDGDNKALYIDFNKGLREGKDKYPVFHYWLNKAVQTLHAKGYTYGEPVYRGYSIHLIATQGDKMTLSGFTSTSKSISVSKAPLFLKPGCTWMNITTKMGVDIENMSASPHEKEVLIPPQEKFMVARITTENDHPTIYLSPVGRIRRDTVDSSAKLTDGTYKYNVCRGNYHELSVELVIAALVCSFYL